MVHKCECEWMREEIKQSKSPSINENDSQSFNLRWKMKWEWDCHITSQHFLLIWFLPFYLASMCSVLPWIRAFCEALLIEQCSKCNIKLTFLTPEIVNIVVPCWEGRLCLLYPGWGVQVVCSKKRGSELYISHVGQLQCADGRKSHFSVCKISEWAKSNAWVLSKINTVKHPSFTSHSVCLKSLLSPLLHDTRLSPS